MGVAELIGESEVEETELDETSAAFIDELVTNLISFCEDFSGTAYFPYQLPIAYSIIESVVLGDGDLKTLVASRQSGKSQVMASVIAGLMVILPRLSSVYPFWLDKFSNGFWCGVFAPTEEQADTIYGRVVGFLTSDHAVEFLEDLGERAASGGTRGKGKVITLKKSGSLCRMQTCNTKAKIEGRTYHLAFVDEAQGAAESVITKSIVPMLAWNNGTLVLAGTATREKCYFYKIIQDNKRRDVNSRRRRKCQSHHEYNYKIPVKYNENYAKFINQQKTILGEDSDEFRLSFLNEWILEKGMFISPERLETIYDHSQGRIHQYWDTPIVVGIDLARSNDSTVVTAMFVDWDHPDGLGFYHHAILDWLEINDVEWEQQIMTIVSWLKNFNVYRVGVDAQGLGGPIAERLAIVLPPHIEVIGVSSDAKTQNDRWNRLTQLIQRSQFSAPGHSKARATKAWKKFNQQMGDLQLTQRGPYNLYAAPDERGAFDDFPDSAAIACAMSAPSDDDGGAVEVYNFSFYDRYGR